MRKPVTGDVWSYPYLWNWQDQSGETEGRKQRPIVFSAVVKRSDGQTGLYILPITSQEPGEFREAIEVPQTEKRRAGLDQDIALWIILDEHNLDILEQSFYFESRKYIGTFSKAFISDIATHFIAHLRAGSTGRVNRL
ncbi:MAG: hypothetical protein HQ483_01555 [Rhodospirillales bacterium]|nr:hypothetical protein [Rhodospirillales bacterium]